MSSFSYVFVLVQFFIFWPTCRVSSQDKFVGCYQDFSNVFYRRLQGHVEVWKDSLTKSRCIDLCYRMGYAYAGLEIGLECFCGNDRPSRYHTHPDECNYTCPGDPSAHECGGNWRIAIYKTDFPNNNTFVGCYQDSQDKRLLTGYEGQWPNDLTKQNCISHCLKSGFLYAGLEASIECFCGDEKPMGYHLSPDYCKNKCSGDNAPECGGNWIAAIYKTEIPNESVEGKYVGCFKNEGSTNILNRYHVTLIKTNSPRRCFNICIKLGFTYTGVENGNKCHCGISRPLGSPVDENQCNSQCSGDSSKTCGGNKFISVYSPEDQSSFEEQKFIGCYPDSADNRILTGHKALWPDSLTKKSCLDLCYRMGYLYAALEISIECFCGNERPWRYHILPSQCNYTCSGDHSSNICGGNWKAAVYETNFPEDNKFMGCYSDSANDRKLTGAKEQWFTNLTKVDCISHCFRLGYLYAGLEAGAECYCGDDKPVAYYLTPLYDCKSKCSGNNKEECGGNFRIAIYKTEIPDKPDTGKYIGCFRDTGRKKLLNRHRVVLENTNSPRRCLNICTKLGFSFSGVENGNECHCGVSHPLGAPVADSDCHIKCPGDEAEKCGANQAIRVYRTGDTDVNPLSGYFTNKNTDEITPPVSRPIVIANTDNCDLSVTTVNGRSACKEKLVFNELFDSPLSDNIWNYVIKIADAPDYEFVLYSSDQEVINVDKGQLMIKAVLQSDSVVTEGKIDLGSRCTGEAGSKECVNQALAYLILPPVRTAKITTRTSFNFRYGKIEIRAKFPIGDWIVPEILLEPKYSEYGPGYRSGRIRIAMVRGNKELYCEGRNVENELTCEAMASASFFTIKSRLVKPAQDDDWKGKFHDYILMWTPDKITFSVDGQPEQTLISNYSFASDMLGFNHDEQQTWQYGSRMAPFDKEFYISVGLAVGGIRDFPNSCINKPWRNMEVKQVLNFWRAKNKWLPTWVSPFLEIDYIKVTAL